MEYTQKQRFPIHGNCSKLAGLEFGPEIPTQDVNQVSNASRQHRPLDPEFPKQLPQTPQQQFPPSIYPQTAPWQEQRGSVIESTRMVYSPPHDSDRMLPFAPAPLSTSSQSSLYDPLLQLASSSIVYSSMLDVSPAFSNNEGVYPTAPPFFNYAHTASCRACFQSSHDMMVPIISIPCTHQPDSCGMAMASCHNLGEMENPQCIINSLGDGGFWDLSEGSLTLAIKELREMENRFRTATKEQLYAIQDSSLH